MIGTRPALPDIESTWGSMRTGRPRSKFAELPPGWLESVEKLEQLRLLEAGIHIYVAGAPADTIGVDTEEDLQRAEALLMERAGSS